MDDPDNDLLENYYGNAEQASEVLESQPTTTTTTTTASVDGADDGTGTSVYGQVLPAHLRRHQASRPTGIGSTSEYIGDTSMYGIDSTGQLTQTTFSTSHPGWQTHNQSPMFTTDGSTTLAANPSLLNPFEYQQFQEVQHATAADMSPLLFSGNYAVPPTTAGTSLGYSYSMDGGGRASGLGSDTTGLSSGAGSVSTVPSPLSTTTPASFTSGSSSGPYATRPSSAVGGLSERGAGSRGSGSQPGAARGKPEDAPQAKRPKRTRRSTVTKAPAQHRASFSSDALSPLSPSMPPPSQPSSSRATSSGKQRRVSSSSKASTKASLDTADEPTMRGSHNVIEKQYRNRLNAQFEGLMSALPESLRNQGPSGQSYGEMGMAEAADRRPSKAEVLELARQHIQSLERERDTLERERNELLSSMEELKEEYAKGAVALGKPADDWRLLLIEEERGGGRDKGKGVDRGAFVGTGQDDDLEDGNADDGEEDG